MRKFIQIASLLSCVGSSLSAETSEPYPIYELEPIIVRATGFDLPILSVPAAVTYVGQSQIQDASAQLSINEALQSTPGVFALNPYNYAQDSRIAIRGFGARSNFGIRGIRLVVDGIPATLPDGQAGVDGIDLGSTQSLEIIRGPAAAIYGPASGGVIRITTEDAPKEPFLETRFTGGSYDLFKSQFKAGYSDSSLNVLVSSSYLDYKGYRANSRTENSALNTKIRYSFQSGAELTTLFNAIDYPIQDDPGGLTAAEMAKDPRQARDRNLQFDGGERVAQEKLGLSYRAPLFEDNELHMHGFFVRRDFANKLPFQNGGQVSFDRLYFGGGASYMQVWENFRGILGVEFGQQEDDRKNFDNLDGLRGEVVLNQQENVLNVGSFLSLEFTPSDKIRLSASLRFDEVHFDVDDRLLTDGDDSGQITFRELSPSVGATWSVSEALSLYANVATSFETPTTTELDNPSGGGFNESLAAQTALSFEVGARGQWTDTWGHPMFDLALFSVEVDDALVPFELAAFPDREFYRNAGSTQKNGFEAAVHLQLLEDLIARVSYTFSDFSYEAFELDGSDFSGNRLPGVPVHFGNLQLEYHHASGVGAVWNTRYVGAMKADDRNLTTIGDYHVSDLRLRWTHQIKRWELEIFAGLNNIFDQRYASNIRINAFGGRYFEPAPTRNAYAGLRLRYLLGTH